MNGIVQRATSGTAVHHLRNVGDQHHAIERNRGRRRVSEEFDHFVGASLANEQSEEPFGRGEQRQRWNEIRQHQVLHHVHGIEIFLGNVVHGPVASQPQECDHERKC